jgi:putative DNA primase/helicase
MPKQGDFVQWTSGGVDQFPSPRKVVSVSDSGGYCFVEGSATGLPVDEVAVIPGGAPAAAGPAPSTSHQVPRPQHAGVNEAADDPHRLARILLAEYQHEGQSTLRFHRDEFHRWARGAYRIVSESELQSSLAATIKDEFDRLNLAAVEAWEALGEKDERGKPAPKPEARKVSRNLVANAALALQSMTLLPGDVVAPAWIDDKAPFDPSEVVPTRNALVYLPEVVKIHPMHRAGTGPVDQSMAVASPTPHFFCPYALDFSFDPDSPTPDEWLKFLDLLWHGDPESIGTLQEWFGYCLTADTRQQKILFLVGPKRAGKDTIARILTTLVGAENVGDPTVASLANPFGLAPLIGKPLAVVSDARLSGRIDTSVIVERLLTISGEGRLTIDRKYTEAWTGKLPTRFVLISNELPKVNDASGALASRLILLRLTESFLGREDKALFDRLCLELPGVFLWAVEGWRRLRERGQFLQPKSGEDLIESLEELTSPVLAFLRDRCEMGAGKMYR